MQGRELHFIAIGGAGMSALALVCHARGARVTGSDQAESGYLRRLRNAGIEPRVGHDAESVPAGAEVVVSTAIEEDNVELVRARERGQRTIHRGKLLAEICAAKRLIAVAGAHGKTTTSGMIAHALRAAGADPAFLLGGELPGGGPEGGPANAAWGSGDWVVAEADESDGSFLELRPEVAVVTNVELDHHSHWGGERELIAAFAAFAASASALVRPAEPRLAGLDGAGSVLSFSIGGIAGSAPSTEKATLLAGNVVVVEGGSEFVVASDGLGEQRVRLSVPGRHNVADAVAAIGALERARGLDPDLPPIEDLIAGLASFPGMARRLERKGERDGALIYDDYAHHPTEVRATLEAARTLAPKRVVACFQPHLYSRTAMLAREFGEALALADVVCVLDVYPARERAEDHPGVSGWLVAAAAASAARGRRVYWTPGMDDAERLLRSILVEGDLLLTLGAGDIDGLAARLVSG